MSSAPVAQPVTAKGWTILGLLVALFWIPLLSIALGGLGIQWSVPVIVGREIAIFGVAGLVLAILRRKEGLPWRAVGLGPVRWWHTALLAILTIVATGFVLAATLFVISFLRLPVGGPEAARFAALPLWVTLLIVTRAGIVEELFYRGYSMERLFALTGDRRLAFALPLLCFAAFHYRQGVAGILLALLLGAVLAGAYAWQRNLWLTISVHFLTDFIPNVAIPLLTRRH